MHHLYEIVLESHQMWIKFQASCSSSEQALAFLEHHLGGEDPDPPVPVCQWRRDIGPLGRRDRVPLT